MNLRNREPPSSAGAAQSDPGTAAYQQRVGGDDPPGKRPSARLPHERDESARGGTGEHPAPSDQQISQAAEDVERGLVDTDRRGVPNDVPTRKTT